MVHVCDLIYDTTTARQLRGNGYAVINLLSSSELAALQGFYDTWKSISDAEPEFYTSIWSTNIDYRREANTFIENILFSVLAGHIGNIQPVFSNFMVKSAGVSSSLQPHQDWSFVEEPVFDSATVWCPLVDVDKWNGNLQVIPGSHQLKNYIRPRFAEAPFRKINEQSLAKMLIDVPMKGGQAIIVNSRTIHASPNNLSGTKRLAASIVVAPKEAPLYHWEYLEGNQGGLQQKYAITKDFFWQYSCFQKPEGMDYIEKTPYTQANILFDQLKKITAEKKDSSIISLWKKLTEIIS